MTQEDKELLLKDLCARLPYGFTIHRPSDNANLKIKDIDDFAHFLEYSEGEEFKPYLRPISSMTEDEEGKELERLFCEIDAPCWVDTEYGCVNFAGGNDFIDTEMAEVYTDWLNAHHFDYRGLIEKGLALEAPADMYKNEK